MSECEICCEKFNLQNHKKVVCPFCDYNTCRTCVQTYLTTTINDPHCPACKKEWNREFVDKSCTKTFRNKDLKRHRENVLLEREKSYLPEAQIAVARRKKAIAIRKQIASIQENIRTQKLLIDNLEHNFNVLQRGHDVDDDAEGEAGSSTKRAFVKKCPVEDCRGFLSTQWKCELCENKICPRCNEIKNSDEHECDPNNVETVNLLKKDTKGCPKCGTLINKSSGCSQMWCPNCHTAFNWNTLKIEKGIIHNPHFYEYQRRTGNGGANRVAGDIPCGGLPDMNELSQFFGKTNNNQRYRGGYYGRNYRPDNLSDEENEIYNIHQLINHLENHEFRWEFRGVEEANAHELQYRELRIRYLMGEINEDGWKRSLQQIEKKLYKIRDIYNVLRLFTITSSDLLRQMVVREITQDTCMIEVKALRSYVNTTLGEIRSRYNGIVNPIRENWGYSYRG